MLADTSFWGCWLSYKFRTSAPAAQQVPAWQQVRQLAAAAQRLLPTPRMAHPMSAQGLDALRRFVLDEQGALPISTGYVMVTLAVSIPLGLALQSIYGSLCQAGWNASFILGLF
jgi:hypothetical protein